MKDNFGGGNRHFKLLKFVGILTSILVTTPLAWQSSYAIAPGGAKMVANGVSATLTDVIITASFSDCKYAQAINGASGIRVETGLPLLTGGRYSLTGTLGTTVNGERVLNVTQATYFNTQNLPRPYSVINRSLTYRDFNFEQATGKGQRGITQPLGHWTNMVGLLVRTAGKVVAVAGSQVQIQDGTLKTGAVYVDTQGIYFPVRVGDWIDVTGIASIMKLGNDYVSLVRPRQQSDLHMVTTGTFSLQNESVSPSSGPVIAERELTVYAQYTHPVDYTRLRESHLLINTSLSLANGIALYYDGPTNKLYLKNDNNTAWLGGFAPGSANFIQNSRVIVDCQKTSVQNLGNYRRISWSLNIKRFAADKRYSIWMYVDGTTGGADGWDLFGSLYVVSPPPDPPGS